MSAAQAAAWIGAYLLGSVPTGFLVVRALAHVDVRTVGSGGTGATNAGRVLGRRGAVLVFVLDMAKGWLAVRVLAPWGGGGADPLMEWSCALLAVAGHCYPAWLGFRGGKGVATTVGALAGMLPVLALVFAAVWAGCAAVWRFVSVGSMAGAVAVPVAQAALGLSVGETGFGILLALLIALRHRENVRRLVRGTEPKIGRSSSASK
ncbi:MAG TPA: glycerol-3-phosphate 1-O-acyltransferase PlsY [bacterium]